METSTHDPELGDTVDVRHMPRRLHHPTVFAKWDTLAPGTFFTLCHDEDPRPLYYQLCAEHADELDWDVLEAGPETWRVRVGRTVSP